MKKHIMRLLVLALMGGGSYTVYNYTGTDIILEDGTTLSTKELITHETKEYNKRPLKETDSLTIYIHHTAVPSDVSIESIANYHVTHNNWPAIAYHSAIADNGDILLLNSLHTISYHTAGHNTKGISVVLLGNFAEDELEGKQLGSLKIVLDALCQLLPIKAIKGHRDVVNTTCPGDNAYNTLKEEQIFL